MEMNLSFPSRRFFANSLGFVVGMFFVCLTIKSESQTVVSKPPVGAVLNPQHPLANGLVVCPLINEGTGQSLWDSGTKQSFVMDNPLVWGNLPGTAQFPWAGAALQFNGTPGATMGPGCRIPVGSIPFFQTEPSGTTGITIAYLWSPGTGVAQSARRIGDTDKTSVYTIYESISGQANKWTYTYRNSANAVQLKHFDYTVGDWIFSVVCIKEGECKIYMNGVLVSTSTDLNFHNSWWQGNTVLPIWWHMTEGPFFYQSKTNVVFGGALAGAWMWNRYLSQADVTSLYNNPWGMYVVYSHPTLNLPTNITVPATSKNGAAVNFNSTATDTVDGTLIPVCTPASSAIFPIGNTTVIGSATNSGGLTSTGSFTITVQRTYAAFEDQYGLLNADPTADPFHTGVSNYAAYAFGINPTVPDRLQLPAGVIRNGYLQISYPRWKDVGDLIYIVEVSDDLKTWNSGASYTRPVSVTPIDSTREQAVEGDLMPTSAANQRFIRLRLAY
jgi:hypothetical protein